MICCGVDRGGAGVCSGCGRWLVTEFNYVSEAEYVGEKEKDRGNRAVITTPAKKTGVYVHWNGGPESVCGVLEACKALGYRCPSQDPAYGFAALAAAYSLFFGATGMSVGVGPLQTLDCDNGDNGVYVIEAWGVVKREHTSDAVINFCDLRDEDKEKAEGVRDAIVKKVKALQKEDE